MINNISAIEDILKPEHVVFPEKKDFLPDCGLALLKAGVRQDTQFTLIDNITDNIMKVSDGLYTIITSVKNGDDDYALSLDLTEEIYQKFLELCPEEIRNLIIDALSMQPYRLDNFPEVHLLVTGKIGEHTEGRFEDFVPLIVESLEFH